MYIKMNEDKSLSVTVNTTIYRGEANADTITFFLPQVYEQMPVAGSTVSLRYVRDDATVEIEALAQGEELYRDYLQYVLPIDTRITQTEGDILLWLVVADASGNALFKTGEVIITVYPSQDVTGLLPEEDIDQLDQLMLKVNQLANEKADGLLYDEEDNSLQLSAEGEPIGNEVGLKGGDDDVVEF